MRLPRIGITGHAKLSSTTIDLVRRTLHRVLAPHMDSALVGLTCLAEGTDQIFAQIVLDLGGKIEVILPASDYREKILSPKNVAVFDDLLSRAVAVRCMPFETSGREAYMAASKELVKGSDRLFAVWDGQPSEGLGGTADVVAYGREIGVPVEVIWPEGACRA